MVKNGPRRNLRAFGGASADHEAVLRLDTRPTRHPAKARKVLPGCQGRWPNRKKKTGSCEDSGSQFRKPEVVIEIPIESTIS